MRHNRLIAAVAGAAFAGASLVGCSSDDLDKAAEDAKNKGSEALSDAASKGADAASDAAGKGADATGKGADAAGKGADAAGKGSDKAGDAAADGSKKAGDAAAGGGKAGSGEVTTDLGDFSDDPNAKAVAEFFTLRYEAISGAGDVSALEPITTPARYTSVQGYVAKNQGATGGVTVTVVGVEGDTVDVCAGEGEVKPFTFTVVDGKVGAHAKGAHTC